MLEFISGKNIINKMLLELWWNSVP